MRNATAAPSGAVADIYQDAHGAERTHTGLIGFALKVWQWDTHMEAGCGGRGETRDRVVFWGSQITGGLVNVQGSWWLTWVSIRLISISLKHIKKGSNG